MRILAIDWGTKKTGLAIGDTEVGVAFPYGVITRDLLPKLQTLIQQEKIVLVVLGLPLDTQGNETKNSRRVRELMRRLEAFGVKVQLVDERFTTGLARRTDARASQDDMIAAQILLQEYLDKRVSI